METQLTPEASLIDQSRTDNSDSTSESSHGLSSASKSIKKIISSNRKDKYSVIPNHIRLELIDAVMNRKEKIKRAATRLGINYSSAKSIYQVYRKEGRSDKKVSKKNKAKQQSVTSDDELNCEAFFTGTTSDQVLVLPDCVSGAIAEQAKPGKSEAISKECLLDLDKLAMKLQKSEAHSDSPTTLALNFSRNCSGPSNFSQNQASKRDTEVPTFFSMFKNIPELDKSALAQKAQKASLTAGYPVIKQEEGAYIPRYQTIPLHQDIQAQIKLREDQNALAQEILKNKILTQQLSQLNQMNLLNSLYIQKQVQNIPPLGNNTQEHVNTMRFSVVNRPVQLRAGEAGLKIPPFNSGFQPRKIRLA